MLNVRFRSIGPQTNPNVNNALAHERRFSGLKNDSVGWPPKPRVAGEDQ